MGSRISITRTEDGDYSIVVYKSDGVTLQDLTGWTLEMNVKARAADADPALIALTSATPTEILIDADQDINRGKATAYILSADSAALALSRHVFDLIGIDTGGKRRFLVTGGTLDVRNNV